MKALSIRQPWAWLIVHGSKRVENRSRRTHYRGPVLIHASAGMTIREYHEATNFLADTLPDELPLPVRDCGLDDVQVAVQVARLDVGRHLVGLLLRDGDVLDCAHGSLLSRTLRRGFAYLVFHSTIRQKAWPSGGRRDARASGASK